MALNPVKFERLKQNLAARQITSIPTDPVVDESDPLTTQVGLGGALKQDLAERRQNVQKSIDQYGMGKQSLASASFQTAGQAAGFLGDIFMRGISSLTPDVIEKPIVGGVEKGVKAAVNTGAGQRVTKILSDWATKHPEAAGNLEAMINIAGLIPAGKGVSGIKNTTGKVVEKSLGLTGGTMRGAGRLTQEGGKGVFMSAINPAVKEAERILDFKATNPLRNRIAATLKNEPLPGEPVLRAQTAFEKGLTGTEEMIGVGAKREGRELWKTTIQPALDNSKDVVTKNELFKPILSRIKKTVEPSKKRAYEDAFASIQEDYKDLENIPLNIAQDIKSQLDTFTPEKVFRGKPVSSEEAMLRADMADAIRQKIYTSLKDENIRKEYLDYANLKELEKVGIKGITEGGKRGGFGTFVTTLWDQATVPVKTIAGRTLYRVGKGIEFTGEKGLKTFGDFLKSKGYKLDKNGFLILTPTITSTND